MNRFFYPRLAWDGLRKNRRLAWPYLLTCICMVAVFYIMGFLCSPATLALLPVGKSSAAIVLTLGKWVILVFSVIFLYYTYSFLIRRRAREFGLYNVLGMGKRNLMRIISWENLITFAAALAGGLLAGILLSKLAELGLMNLLNGTVNYAIRVDVDSVVLTAVCFAAAAKGQPHHCPAGRHPAGRRLLAGRFHGQPGFRPPVVLRRRHPGHPVHLPAHGHRQRAHVPHPAGQQEVLLQYKAFYFLNSPTIQYQI